MTTSTTSSEIWKKVVVVAAQQPRRLHGRSQFETGQRRRFWQNPPLDQKLQQASCECLWILLRVAEQSSFLDGIVKQDRFQQSGGPRRSG